MQILNFSLGCIKVDVDTCQEILAMADMLGIDDVVDICSEFLIENITPYNCVGKFKKKV